MLEHRVIHKLRGKAAPPGWFLDAFEQRFPNLRLAWLPPYTIKHKDGTVSEEHHGCWGLYEYWGSHLWRDAGLARQKQFAQNPGTLDAARAYDIEAQIDGLHMVGTYPDEAMGTERLIRELSESEHQAAQDRALWEEKTREKEASDIEDVTQWDPAFAEYIRLVAHDEYARVCKGAHSVQQPGIPQPKTGVE